MDFLHFILLIPFVQPSLSFAGVHPQLSPQQVDHYRQRVVSMFNTAFTAYLNHAADFDELQPISCSGRNTWGSCSLSLIDALDSTAVLGNFSEFRRISQHIQKELTFDRDLNVSVFETNIRVVGGLLSAHLFSHMAGEEVSDQWPCEGPLLRLSEDVARRLLPAFQTKTGMPIGTVNLKYGVPPGETEVTCCAGVGTFILEFGALSRLTGDPVFEEAALRAIEAMHKTRSNLNLPGNHINVTSGVWTAIESSIGPGVDSFFEYLVKGSMLLHNPRLMELFYVYFEPINRFMNRDDWFFVVHKDSGQVTIPVFQSLESFWPGLLALIGELDRGKKTLYNYHQVLRQYGFLPEMYDVTSSNTKRSGYPLRPEFLESLFYLFRATRDPYLRVMAAEVIEAIEHSAKTDCGYATVKDVNTHVLEDRMESFFLSETLKYLYLIFASEDHFMFNTGSSGELIGFPDSECVIATGGYIFNTEAHPIDTSCLDCCIERRRRSKLRGKNVRHKSEHLLKRTHRSKVSSQSQICAFFPFTKHCFFDIIFRRWDTIDDPKPLNWDYMKCYKQSLYSRFSFYGQVSL